MKLNWFIYLFIFNRWKVGNLESACSASTEQAINFWFETGNPEFPNSGFLDSWVCFFQLSVCWTSFLEQTLDCWAERNRATIRNLRHGCKMANKTLAHLLLRKENDCTCDNRCFSEEDIFKNIWNLKSEQKKNRNTCIKTEDIMN